MFVTNWISTTKIQKISEITNFFRHYFLSRTEVYYEYFEKSIHQEGSASINKIDEEAVCMNTNEDKHVQNAQKQKSGAACKSAGKHRTI